MTDQPEISPGAAITAAAPRLCQFPTAYDPEAAETADDPWVVCGRPLDDVAPRPGRKPEYCGENRIDPDGHQRRHDRAGAFTRKRELERAALGKTAPVQRDRPTPRPVTSARASLADLLAQLEMVAAGHREQMGGLLDRVVDVVGAAGDPDAAVAEVTSMRREAQAEVEAAQARADEAEADAIAARRQRDRAVEDKELADGVAEDALAERDRTLGEAERSIDAIRAEAAAEVEEIRQAETARVEAAEALAAAAQADARAAKERAAEAEAAAEQARRDAAEQVDTLTRDHAARVERVTTDANAQVAAAAAAQQRAESAASAADTRATEARTELAQVKADLSAAREQAREDATAAREEIAGLRRELAEVRAQARAEREQQRNDHLAEIARVQRAAEAGATALQSALTAAENTMTRLQAQLADDANPKETR